MFEPVVGGNFLVINRQLASLDATLVLLGRMRPELTCEHVQDLLAHPPALRERRERKVVRIHFAKAYSRTQVDRDKRNREEEKLCRLIGCVQDSVCELCVSRRKPKHP